jgi:hypothetical protein
VVACLESTVRVAGRDYEAVKAMAIGRSGTVEFSSPAKVWTLLGRFERCQI